MIQTVSRLRSLALWFLLCACFAALHAGTPEEGQATRALRHLVETDPEIKHLLTSSIEQAKRINPDPLTNPAQTLEQYYDFVSFAERTLPGSLIEPKPNATLYQRMDQSLSYLFFISDQPLPELEHRGYFRNSLQYVEPYNAWLKTFVRSWGTFLDTPASWNAEYLRLALADGSFGLSKGWYEDSSRWIALRHLVETDPEIKHLLTSSIEQAKRINPDPLTNPAQTLEQYYDFVSFAERTLPGSLIEPKPNATINSSHDASGHPISGPSRYR